MHHLGGGLRFPSALVINASSSHHHITTTIIIVIIIIINIKHINSHINNNAGCNTL